MDVQKRHIDHTLLAHFSQYKQVLLLLGARQVGKTTILRKLFPSAEYFLVDNAPILNTFETYDINSYNQIIHPQTKQLIIDEIHLLSNPGRCIKIIYDLRPELKIIVTGSSSLHIKNKTGESLAGRKIEYKLYPLTFSEYLTQKGINQDLDTDILDNIISSDQPKQRALLFDLKETLSNILLFGTYPQIINNPKDTLYLKNLIESVIFKDIIDLNLIENKTDALNLLRLLAYQIGNIINYSEISRTLSIDIRTVKRYISIFEDSFIIFRLYPFSNNKRGELSKSPKVYFYDTGLRNALIDDFNDIDIRSDKGALFENFIITEVLKSNEYGNKGYKINYWRTINGAEVDLVISKNNNVIGCEIKYNTGSINQSFVNKYSNAVTKIISSKNFY